jgi:hypothetical protein
MMAIVELEITGVYEVGKPGNFITLLLAGKDLGGKEYGAKFKIRHSYEEATRKTFQRMIPQRLPELPEVEFTTA